MWPRRARTLALLTALLLGKRLAVLRTKGGHLLLVLCHCLLMLPSPRRFVLLTHLLPLGTKQLRELSHACLRVLCLDLRPLLGGELHVSVHRSLGFTGRCTGRSLCSSFGFLALWPRPLGPLALGLGLPLARSLLLKEVGLSRILILGTVEHIIFLLLTFLIRSEILVIFIVTTTLIIIVLILLVLFLFLVVRILLLTTTLRRLGRLHRRPLRFCRRLGLLGR
mmetsp:Transcript_22049/g.44420  ORF Transcript_22049/g.44420 Transcript_22049/m.44420 type:complete len:223 (-) Transcript_22049:37-705(-)